MILTTEITNLQDDGIEKLFFELASESRLAILKILQHENVKMQEIARRLDVTATEAFRQLDRLSAASLIQKQPDGTFAIGEYGKLVLQLSSSLEFASKHKGYFSTHDLTRLPNQFVSRLNELSEARLITDTIEALNVIQNAYMEAEKFSWGIAEGTIPSNMGSIMEQKLKKGIKMRFIIPENRFQINETAPKVKNLEVKGISELPVVMGFTEKEGAVCFRQVGGKIDYVGFYGNDLNFMSWVEDLFLYYWDKGKLI